MANYSFLLKAPGFLMGGLITRGLFEGLTAAILQGITEKFEAVILLEAIGYFWLDIILDEIKKVLQRSRSKFCIC